MSTNVSNVQTRFDYHLSSSERKRLVKLLYALEWLLETDARFGFQFEDTLGLFYPSFFSVARLLWTKRFRLVKKPFRYLGGRDCPRVIVSRDFYEEALSLMLKSGELPF